jgi:hypothetical protein
LALCSHTCSPNEQKARFLPDVLCQSRLSALQRLFLGTWMPFIGNSVSGG